MLTALAAGRWLIQTKSRWDTSQDMELLIPGLIRPRISPEDYGLENDQRVGIDVSHPGQKGILICDHPEIKPGMFIRKPWDLDEID